MRGTAAFFSFFLVAVLLTTKCELSETSVSSRKKKDWYNRSRQGVNMVVEDPGGKLPGSVELKVVVSLPLLSILPADSAQIVLVLDSRQVLNLAESRWARSKKTRGSDVADCFHESSWLARLEHAAWSRFESRGNRSFQNASSGFAISFLQKQVEPVASSRSCALESLRCFSAQRPTLNAPRLIPTCE